MNIIEDIDRFTKWSKTYDGVVIFLSMDYILDNTINGRVMTEMRLSILHFVAKE